MMGIAALHQMKLLKNMKGVYNYKPSHPQQIKIDDLHIDHAINSSILPRLDMKVKFTKLITQFN